MLRVTLEVVQIGSRLERSACGTKRSTPARWPKAGVESSAAPAPMKPRRRIAQPLRMFQ